MLIQHNSIIGNWDNEYILNNAEVLILGSFNPYNPNGLNPDYYYGRKTNYFWKILGEVMRGDANYFYQNTQKKSEIMIEKKFCFLDVIKSIEITCNDNLINSFVDENIYTNFSDAVLFTSRTTYNHEIAKISRTYNMKVQNLLGHGKINNIIHTLGNTTIDTSFKTKPKENRLLENGFQGYFNSILSTNINFVPISYSPSPLAVNPGGSNYLHNLRCWLVENLNLV